MTARDPITLELIKNALSSLVDEMAYTVIQTAHSEIVKDVMDFSTACCDAQGRMLAQGKTIAMHLGAVPEAMEAVQAEFAGDINPGDVFTLNDPYEGGMHLQDVFIIKPVFTGETLAGWMVAVAHQTDMGGRVPGSNASDSTEIYQEGIRIPPLKLYDRGERNDTIIRFMHKNVRVPGRVLGDWGSQLAACSLGEKSYLELVEKYGLEVLDDYFSALLDYSEQMMRAEISAWPDGSYEFTDYLDGDGFDETPIPIKVTLHIDGDSLVADYTGSGEQVTGAINSTLSFTNSCTYLSVRCMIREDIPNNAGVFRPITIKAPEGTIVNVVSPGAVAARAATGYRIVDAMFGALAQIVPDRVPAAGEGGNTVASLSGRREDRSPFIVVDMLCGAWGGRPNADGVDAVTNPSQNMSNTPIEVLEAQHPVRVERYGLVRDTAGAGRFRGGMAISRQYRMLNEGGGLLQLRSDRSHHAPWGLEGGRPGHVSLNFLLEGDEEKPLPNKVTMSIPKGTGVRHQMAGAGGFGDPLERDPGAVLEDVLDDRISREFARREYGVVIDGDAIDEQATSALRDAGGAASGA
ncbi:hydantoinase B/oxoprolinase family protein [Gulosibacter sp. 10]|uniref:hydantoinase B/oxoprolinase family protein n=1 Tax=Gulosibacter sp. 10 TaxID=1255570 RepID=UPI00097EEE5D|nr:hydantoinase B/oxoprolinase family protein [Gulosibacter sp. 10]SJM59470.1 N-methylhydantoinase B [Gulosibacter sp. 10]